MLGQLTEYFSGVSEPVILVFWGDHYNPIGSGYEVYTSTGYASADSNDPQLHQTDLLDLEQLLAAAGGAGHDWRLRGEPGNDGPVRAPKAAVF